MFYLDYGMVSYPKPHWVSVIKDRSPAKLCVVGAEGLFTGRVLRDSSRQALV